MAFQTLPIKKILSKTAVVIAGQTSVAVALSVSIPVSYAVILTPEANVTCWVTNKTATGFTINISASQGANLNVHWIAREN